MTLHPAHGHYAKDYTLLSHYDDNAVPPLLAACLDTWAVDVPMSRPVQSGSFSRTQ